MPVVRTPWRDFPNVSVHTTSEAVSSHPAFASARAGDMSAAYAVILDSFSPVLLAKSLSVKPDFVCPVMRLDSSQVWDPLPLAFANEAARSTGARVVPLIVQDNIVQNFDPLSKITSQPSFSGTVPKGSYLIVDTTTSTGSTLANLRGWIETNGSQVVLASTLCAKIFAAKIRPDARFIPSIKSRFSTELTVFPEKLGFSVDCLTQREAAFINGLKNLECIRNPLASSHNTIRPTTFQ